MCSTKRAIELSVRLRVANELRASDQGPQVTQLIPSEDLRQDQFEAEAKRLKAQHFLQFGRAEELTINTPLMIPMDSNSLYPKKIEIKSIGSIRWDARSLCKTARTFPPNKSWRKSGNIASNRLVWSRSWMITATFSTPPKSLATIRT